jgi:hypothetical protein
MAVENMVTTTLALIGDPNATEDLVNIYLDIAARKMCDRLYPFDPTQTAIPEVYQMDQCELAARLYLRRGAEGEISHNENGINRTYGSVSDEDILSRLTPYVGMPR